MLLPVSSRPLPANVGVNRSWAAVQCNPLCITKTGVLFEGRILTLAETITTFIFHFSARSYSEGRT